MAKPIIQVEHLSKKYLLHHEPAQRYVALRDVITQNVKSLGKYLRRRSPAPPPTEEFWALKDISFTIQPGDRVGIIGRNGAGKSTLLKVLSRITEPTAGRITLRGRVASLLEVGTGFHPELTGRENIFLNGAILGMSNAEIQGKFDEIVSFAEVEKFLDTPVKHYSSGMYMRLAFAVAAHLEPELLLVDEVLAVGDAQFQQKCLGKMEDVAQNEGRTILFVSHNMGAILSLCNRAILLDRGTCLAEGNPDSIIAKYLASGSATHGEVISLREPMPQQKLKIRKARLVDHQGQVSGEFDSREAIFLGIDFEVLLPGRGYSLAFQVHNTQYGCIFTSGSLDIDPDRLSSHYWQPGHYQARIQLPTTLMRGGEYWIRIASAVPTVEMLDQFDRDLFFHLLDTTSPIVKTSEGRLGAILPILEWNVLST